MCIAGGCSKDDKPQAINGYIVGVDSHAADTSGLHILQLDGRGIRTIVPGDGPMHPVSDGAGKWVYYYDRLSNKIRRVQYSGEARPELVLDVSKTDMREVVQLAMEPAGKRLCIVYQRTQTGFMHAATVDIASKHTVSSVCIGHYIYGQPIWMPNGRIIMAGGGVNVPEGGRLHVLDVETMEVTTRLAPAHVVAIGSKGARIVTYKDDVFTMYSLPAFDMVGSIDSSNIPGNRTTDDVCIVGDSLFLVPRMHGPFLRAGTYMVDVASCDITKVSSRVLSGMYYFSASGVSSKPS